MTALDFDYGMRGRSMQSNVHMCRVPLRRVSLVPCVILSALLSTACSTVPVTPAYWQDLTGQNRNDDDLRPDLAACNAAYSEAFEEAQRDVPAEPAAGPSSTAMALETIATVNLWKSTATRAFNDCMNARNWRLAPSVAAQAPQPQCTDYKVRKGECSWK